MLDLSCDLIQGSILVTILCVIHIFPLFVEAELTHFANDNFIIEWNRSHRVLVRNMEAEVDIITR